jgi:hypothetical protein
MDNNFLSFPITDWLMNTSLTSQESICGDIIALSFMSCSLISDCITMCPRYIHYTISEDKEKEKNIINLQPN